MNSKGTDQPAHVRRLIPTFAVHYLGIMSVIFIGAKFSGFYVLVAGQAGLSMHSSLLPPQNGIFL